MKQINYLYLALPAFIVDTVAFIATYLVLPRLVPIMQEPGGTSALIMGGTFLLFISGVFVFRKMKATPSGITEWLSRGRRIGLALFFAIVASLMLARQLGFFASSALADTTQMGEGGSASYFVFGPGAWLAFSLLYVLVFGFTVTPTIDYPIRYGAAALFGLAATDAMLTVFVAQMQAILLEMGAKWWWAFIGFLLLMLLFGPPRLLYVSRTLGLRSPMAYAVIVFFLLVLGVFATQMIITLF